MRKKICYDKNKLLALLPDFSIQSIKFIESDEDSDINSNAFFIVKREDIVEISKYYSLWTSEVVTLSDGTVFKLYSNNINADDDTLLRINRNNVVSPKLNLSDDFIEAREDLREWLVYNGIKLEELEELSTIFTVYTEIEYLGVGTPVYFPKSDSWGISSETLKLNEKEIEKVLNSIEDELLRHKIKEILYARVFKQVY